MKRYGYNFATEITKGQIGVIYRNAKLGNLKVEKWVIKELYDLADYYGMDSNRGVAQQEGEVQMILEEVFKGNFEEAQEQINERTEQWFNQYGSKMRAKLDRSILC